VRALFSISIRLQAKPNNFDTTKQSRNKIEHLRGDQRHDIGNVCFSLMIRTCIIQRTYWCWLITSVVSLHSLILNSLAIRKINNSSELCYHCKKKRIAPNIHYKCYISILSIIIKYFATVNRYITDKFRSTMACVSSPNVGVSFLVRTHVWHWTDVILKLMLNLFVTLITCVCCTKPFEKHVVPHIQSTLPIVTLSGTMQFLLKMCL
jgi:hypothetical protein